MILRDLPNNEYIRPKSKLWIMKMEALHIPLEMNYNLLVVAPIHLK